MNNRMKKFLKNAYFSLKKIKFSKFRKNREKLGLLICQGMLKCIHVCPGKCLGCVGEILRIAGMHRRDGVFGMGRHVPENKAAGCGGMPRVLRPELAGGSVKISCPGDNICAQSAQRGMGMKI